MPQSELRLFKRCIEKIEKKDARRLARKLRGIYVLYEKLGNPKTDQYKVLYIGMASTGRQGGIRSRLLKHAESVRKAQKWTHFSAYEAWDNIRGEEIAELEGILRHIYRDDPSVNQLNIQRGFKKIRRIRDNKIENWRKA